MGITESGSLGPGAAGLARFAAKVPSHDLDGAAYLKQSGPHPLANPVGQRVIAHAARDLAAWKLRRLTL